MDGPELVARLRKQKFPCKIIVFCSELSPFEAADSRVLHVHRILNKPAFPSPSRAPPW